MAILRMKEAKSMSDEELDKRLEELYLELAKEKANVVVSGTVKNPGRIREIRRTIARISTLKKQRESIKKKKEVG